MNTVTEPKTLDQAQRIYTLTEFIKRIRIKTSAGESIEPELAQAMHYINEGAETHVPAYAELQAENERLKEALGEHGIATVMELNTYRSRLHGLCQGPEPHTAEEAAEQIRGRMAMYRNKIADLESQLAAANEKLTAIPRGAEAWRTELDYLDVEGWSIWKNGPWPNTAEFIAQCESEEIARAIVARANAQSPQASASAASKLTDEEITELWISAGQRPRWFARAIEQRTQASAGVKVPEGMQLIRSDVVEFLRGAGLLCGCAFNERPLGEKGNFWWRKYLSDEAAPSAPIAEQQWQPIETAPKDGSDVLLIDVNCKNPTADLAHFAEGKWIACSSDLYADMDRPGYWEIGTYETPTHWQPLPAPPSDSLGGEG